MQKGQFVRKQLSDGSKIGPCCIITGFKGYKSELVRLESLDGVVNSYVKRERVSVLKSIKMIIGHNVYTRIEKEIQHSIIHDVTPKWKKLFDKQPEVIQLRDELYEKNAMVFYVEETRKVYYEGDIQIRIDLGERLL